jgi:uncharacterized membrane protein/glutaredoxin
LFSSSTCPHCQKVIREDLPPLQDRFGNQLNILEINVGEKAGQALYRAAVEKYNIPEDRRGVPCLIVGDKVLVGSREIPNNFPEIIEASLTTGGLPWPDIPGLKDVLPSQAAQASETPTPALGTGIFAMFVQDPVGNSLAVLVLIALLVSAIISNVRVIRLSESDQHLWPEWIPPTLILIGSGIAVYLSYVEITHSQAVCGPVGDCNTVQQSPYATLLGIIPVGLLGMAGYILIAIGWLAQKFGADRWKNFGALAVWVFTLFGVLFFIYLTFLEPFVIGATCAWCLASAVVMILLLWAATPPAIEAWKTSAQE